MLLSTISRWDIGIVTTVTVVLFVFHFIPSYMIINIPQYKSFQ
jgi:hypothetical protein